MNKKQKYLVGQMRPQATLMLAAAVVVVAKLQSVSIFLTRHAFSAGCVKNIKLETVGLSNYLFSLFKLSLKYTCRIPRQLANSTHEVLFYHQHSPPMSVQTISVQLNFHFL